VIDHVVGLERQAPHLFDREPPRSELDEERMALDGTFLEESAGRELNVVRRRCIDGIDGTDVTFTTSLPR